MASQLPRDRPLRLQFLRVLFDGVGGRIVILGIGVMLWVYWHQIAAKSWRPSIQIISCNVVTERVWRRQ